MDCMEPKRKRGDRTKEGSCCVWRLGKGDDRYPAIWMYHHFICCGVDTYCSC